MKCKTGHIRSPKLHSCVSLGAGAGVGDCVCTFGKLQKPYHGLRTSIPRVVVEKKEEVGFFMHFRKST